MQAPQRLQPPAQGLQFWAWLAHWGRGNEQVTSQVPSRTGRQVTASGNGQRRGQESRSDANPWPNYLKGSAARRCFVESPASSISITSSSSGPVSTVNWLAIPHPSPSPHSCLSRSSPSSYLSCSSRTALPRFVCRHKTSSGDKQERKQSINRQTPVGQSPKRRQ